MKIWKFLGTLTFWVGWPVIYLTLRFSHRTRLIVTYKDQVLLLKNWLGPNEWSLPGGGVRRGELPALAALRELAEETGIQTSSNQLKLVYHQLATVHGLKFFYYGFLLKLDELVDIKRHSLDVVDSHWVKRQELFNQALAPDARHILRDWLAS